MVIETDHIKIPFLAFLDAEEGITKLRQNVGKYLAVDYTEQPEKLDPFTARWQNPKSQAIECSVPRHLLVPGIGFRDSLLWLVSLPLHS